MGKLIGGIQLMIWVGGIEFKFPFLGGGDAAAVERK